MIRDRQHCEWRLDDLLTFELRDDTLRHDWYGKWIGVVRPHLEWRAAPLPGRMVPAPDSREESCQ
jgi:hypothetical protein